MTTPAAGSTRRPGRRGAAGRRPGGQGAGGAVVRDGVIDPPPNRTVRPSSTTGRTSGLPGSRPATSPCQSVEEFGGPFHTAPSARARTASVVGDAACDPSAPRDSPNATTLGRGAPGDSASTAARTASYIVAPASRTRSPSRVNDRALGSSEYWLAASAVSPPQASSRAATASAFGEPGASGGDAAEADVDADRVDGRVPARPGDVAGRRRGGHEGAPAAAQALPAHDGNASSRSESCGADTPSTAAWSACHPNPRYPATAHAARTTTPSRTQAAPGPS